MKKTVNIALFSVSLSFISMLAYAAQNDTELLTQAKAIFKPLPAVIPAPKDNPSTVEKVALGKRLYFEKKLSLNNTMSCNTCHNLGNYGVDNQPTSLGVKGKRGGRNSPTVFNAGLHISQFWDGRAKNLEEQAAGPVLNPIEMAMPSQDEVVKRLKSDKNYPGEFKSAFKNDPAPITYKNMTKAIADFERTLVTPSRFDKFLNGDLKALTQTEKDGLRMFINKGCISCHNGVTVGGQMYQKFGVIKPYQFQKDQGRFEITKAATDKFVFKVPSLRNIEKTAPYFHDGKVTVLKDAIKTMGRVQLGITITESEADSLSAFLKSLTGEVKKQ